jgi:3-deoxy-D-manno-octulosonic-acid transferase
MTFFIIEIKVLLAQEQPMELILVPREINRVSHVLANLGRYSSRTQTWYGDGPDDVMAL